MAVWASCLHYFFLFHWFNGAKAEGPDGCCTCSGLHYRRILSIDNWLTIVSSKQAHSVLEGYMISYLMVTHCKHNSGKGKELSGPCMFGVPTRLRSMRLHGGLLPNKNHRWDFWSKFTSERLFHIRLSYFHSCVLVVVLLVPYFYVFTSLFMGK